MVRDLPIRLSAGRDRIAGIEEIILALDACCARAAHANKSINKSERISVHAVDLIIRADHPLQAPPYEIRPNKKKSDLQQVT